MANGSSGGALLIGGRLTTSADFGIDSANSENLAVASLRADGTVDPSFGQGGAASVTLPTGDYLPAGIDLASTPILLVKGARIDLVASVNNAANQPLILVAQFTADGLPDTSFGINGQALVNIGAAATGFRAQEAIFQGDQIVVGGSFLFGVDQYQGHALALVRLTAEGQIDTSFGTGGAETFSTILHFSSPNAIPFEDVSALTETPDGGIALLAQATLSNDQGFQTELFHFQASGTVDTTFGGGSGFVLFNYATVGQFTSEAVQPDGRIIVYGYGGYFPIGSNNPSKIIRLNVDGTTEAIHVFDAPGQNLVPLLDRPSVVVQPDGEIVVAGQATGVSQGANSYAIVRLKPDLTPDPAFGVYQGAAPFGSSAINGGYLTAFGIDAVGSYVVSGYDNSTQSSAGVFLARVLGSASTTASAIPSSDLSITVTSTSPSPSVGATTRVSLTVSNLGPTDATNVIVTDTLPPGSIYGGVVSSQGGALVGTEALLGTIPSGGSATVTFSYVPATTGAATNSDQVTSDQADSNPANNTVTQTLTILPAPDLSVVETLIGTGRAGDIQLFHLIVTNNGLVAATGVELVDAFPTESVILNVAPTQGSVIDQSQGQATVNLGLIAPGGSATVVVVYVPQGFGIFNNAALVSSDTTDPVPANNFAILGIYIPISADLDLRQSFAGDQTSGDLQTFTVTVKNQGNVPVHNVVLADALPDHALITEVIPSQGFISSLTNGLATIKFAELFPGDVATITIGYVPRGPGAFINRAAVSSEEFDEKPVNNFSYEASVVFDGPVVTGLTQSANHAALILSFNESIDLTTAKTLANYQLFDLGTTPNPAKARSVPIPSVRPAANGLTVKITPSQLLPSHYYKLVLDGTSPTGLVDFLGHRLDGDYSGRPGSDDSVIFRTKNLPVFPGGRGS